MTWIVARFADVVAVLAFLRDVGAGIALAALEHIAELLQAIIILAGWLLVTRGIASLTTPKIWPLSIGLLLLLLAGVRWLASLFWIGLYKLRELALEEEKHG